MGSMDSFKNNSAKYLGLFIGTIATQTTTAAGIAYALSKYTLSPELMARSLQLLPPNPIAFRMAFPIILGSFIATDMAIIPPILAINKMTKN